MFVVRSDSGLAMNSTCCFGQIDTTVDSFATGSMGYTTARSSEAPAYGQAIHIHVENLVLLELLLAREIQNTSSCVLSGSRRT